jgi:two-component system, chemotaxis family, sensor kinase CheA
LNALTEYEEHRLLENVKKGRNVYSVRASFSLDTFDQELAELTDLLKSRLAKSSARCRAPGQGIALTIDFEILFGSDKNAAEVTAMVDRENVAIAQLGNAEAEEELVPTPETETTAGAMRAMPC